VRPSPLIYGIRAGYISIPTPWVFFALPLDGRADDAHLFKAALFRKKIIGFLVIEQPSFGDAVMFSADLSWADDNCEKVGERRKRKKDGSESIASSSSSQSKQQAPVQKVSLSGKASFSSVKGSFRRPSTSANRHMRKNTLPPIDANTTFKDPLEQPDWILSGKFIPKLPSGTPLDPPHSPPPPFLPELDLDGSDKTPENNDEPAREHGRIMYSRQENSSCELRKTDSASARLINF
jgi:hypothetical protein